VTLNFRPAEARDASFLAEMLVAAAFWRTDGPSGRVTGDLGVIALSGQRRVGAAWARMLPESDPGYGFVDPTIPEMSLAVVQAWRGRGVGTRLLNVLIANAREQGLASLSLSVEPDNGARRLYERAGFRQVDQVGGSLTMLLQLSGTG